MRRTLADACRGAGVVDIEALADRTIEGTIRHNGRSWEYALKVADSLLLERSEEARARIYRADHNRIRQQLTTKGI